MKNMYRNTLTREQMSLIVGSMLGDGYITKHKEGERNSCLTIEHTEKQLEYLLWKKELFEKNGFFVSKVYERKVNQYGHKQYIINITFKEDRKIFNHLRDFIYTNGRKTITRKILNWLDETGLAIMHQDDGSAVVNINKLNEKVRWRAIHIATYNMSYEEHLVFQKYFKTVWGIDIKIYKDRKLYRTCINSTNCKKYIPLIKDFIHPSMEYKIDLKYSV